MMEDEDYRTSSQYRCWSYPQGELEEIRRRTNAAATEKVQATVMRANPVLESADAPTLQIQPLSIQEELLIVEMGSDKIVQMGEHMQPRVPASIIATAIQYLRRFYLSNSPMIYHPRQIAPCALFLAMKADHFYKSLHDFVTNLDNITEDDVKAPEFLLMQGLRFTLSVWHPMRGLEGGVMDIQALVSTGYLGNLQRSYQGKGQSASQRIAEAANHAKTYLQTAAQMTDAYFLYTPSQIWLGALSAVDSDLTIQYLKHICSKSELKGVALFDKVLSKVTACAELLVSYKAAKDDLQKEKEMRRAARKLKNLQIPGSLDVAGLAKAKAAEKRTGTGSEAADKALKKRKLEREKLERDGDVFGTSLT